ncbi:MAG: hypothetical protein V4714_13140 [Bacteroidota bacterium]
MKVKFTAFDSENKEVAYEYGNWYELEKTHNSQRLKIGPSTDHIDLLLKLAQTLNPPYYVLYVLVVTRLGNEYGRYQSPIIDTKEELSHFLLSYQDYFETDGRHHVWIGTVDNSGLLIYDQHNVIYAYGSLNSQQALLNKLGFKAGNFNFPIPHMHYYHPENDLLEKDILLHWDWEQYPLEDSDLYD